MNDLFRTSGRAKRGGWKKLSGLIPRCAVALLLCALVLQATGQTPAVGAKVPDFTLSTPMGEPIRLSGLLNKGTVVLIVLRGFPGYQCPYCQRQVHDFVDHAPAFAARNAAVLLVYPGPPAALDDHAKEFLATQSALPTNVQLVIDPEYAMTNQYGLRWNAPHETAYPSTFVVDRNGKVITEKISRGHGDRTSAEEVLSQLPKE